MHVYLYVDKYMYVGQFFGAFYFLRFMVIHVILCTFCFSRFQSILSFYPIHYFMYLALKIEFRLYSIDNTVDNKPNPISGGTSHLPVHIRHFIIYFFLVQHILLNVLRSFSPDFTTQPLLKQSRTITIIIIIIIIKIIVELTTFKEKFMHRCY